MDHYYDNFICLHSCRAYHLRLVQRHGLSDISDFFALSRSMNALPKEIFFRYNFFQFDHDMLFCYQGLAQCCASDLTNLRYLHIELWELRRLRNVFDWVAFLHYLHRVTHPAALHLKLIFEEECLAWDREQDRLRKGFKRIGKANSTEEFMTMTRVKELFEGASLSNFGKLELAWPKGEETERPHWETVMCFEDGVQRYVEPYDYYEWVSRY